MSRARVTRAELGSLYDRSLFEQRRGIVGWVSGIAFFCLVMLAMYPTIHANTSFSKLIDAYPEALRKLFDISDYTTGPGYLRTEVFSFMAPLLVTIYAILQGSDLLAGEEERRTIDLLLANPISRRRVVLEKWLALATGVIVLSLVLELLLGLAGPLFELHLGWRQLSAAVLGTALFALFGGTFALAWGAATGARGAARGVSAAVVIAMYLLSALAQLVAALKSFEWASLWYHALGGDPLTTGFHYGHLGVLVVFIGALLAAAVRLFERRDLTA
ncbi:MAG: ABC transporter permease subunit [Acidobacteria bacterium]|nr:ABC transporter permease subunit [Acidobacteriota bacterium]